MPEPGVHSGVWVLGEERDQRIHPVSYELLAWGRGLADKLEVDLSCVILGASAREKAEELLFRGADRVYVAQHSELGAFRVDPFSRILVTLVQKHRPEILIAAATTMGRTIMPVLAAKLRVGLTADCTSLDIEPSSRLLLQTRPAIGGNVMATIKTPVCRPQMATVRPKSMRPLPHDDSRMGEVREVQIPESDLRSRVGRIAFQRSEGETTPVEEADIVVAGGKGMKNAKGFARVIELAARLDGAVGASRNAVDLGWVPYAHQIGLSGKTVSPRLYLALGISGTAAHIAGMSSSEIVIAVNKDPRADIFKVADFGIVGDVFEVLPALMGRLAQEDRDQRK